MKNTYSSWLADTLFNGQLAWKTATKTTLERLLAQITLHDSSWYSTVLPDANTWILVIQLDAIWNKVFCHQLTDWPFLLLKFKQVVCSFQDFSADEDYVGIIGDAETAALDSSSVTEWTNLAAIASLLPAEAMQRMRQAQDLQRTRIVPVCGGVLTLIHRPEIEVLLFTEAGTQLAVGSA